jgi:hypothetical protein
MSATPLFDDWRALHPELKVPPHKQNKWRYTDASRQSIEMQLDKENILTVFDAGDLIKVEAHKYWFSCTNFKGISYAACNEGVCGHLTRHIKLHRAVCDMLCDERIVHIDQNKLNNRQANLRCLKHCSHEHCT